MDALASAAGRAKPVRAGALPGDPAGLEADEAPAPACILESKMSFQAQTDKHMALLCSQSLTEAVHRQEREGGGGGGGGGMEL